MSRTLAAVLLTLFAASAALAQEKYTIKQAYPEGTYVETTDVAMQQEMTIGDNTMKQNIEMMMSLELAAQKPTDQGQTVTVTIKRMKQSISGGPVKMEYDTENPTANSPVGKIYDAMLDLPIEMVISPDGKTVQVGSMDNFWDSVAKAMPNPAMALNVKKQFSTEMFKKMVTQSLNSDKPVAKGESWTSDTTMELPFLGAVSLKRNYTLADVTGNVATIKVEAKLSSSTTTMPASSPAPNVKVDNFDITMSGTSTMDLATGLVKATDIDQKGKIDLTVSNAQTQPENRTLATEGKVKIVLQSGKYEGKPRTETPTSQP